MRVALLRAALALALAVASAHATPRGLRANAETSDLSFADLRGDVAAGLSFDTIAGDGSAPGSVREVAVSNGSQAAPAPAYTRPSGASFYDLVGDLSSKWAQFADGVPVAGAAKTSLAASCGTLGTDACVLACAKSCFANNACQWFTLAPATQDCYLYQSLRPVAGVSFSPPAADAQRIAGYIKAAPAALLNAKATCTSTVVYNDKDSFCASGESTYYIETKATKAATSQCATSPLTLLRSFQNNFFNKGSENAMAEELENGKLKNAGPMAPQQIGGDFTVESFLEYIGSGETPGVPFVVSTADMTVDATTQQLADAGTKTEWSYKFDSHGRVTSVSSTLAPKNLLFTKDTVTGKMTERKDYCKPGLQTRFSYSIHALSAVNAQTTPLPFGAGEIASCLFTSPNGFWNLIPQNDNSRSTGCAKQANDLIAKLLEWGFTLDFKAEPKYFTSVDTVKTEATAASVKSKDLLSDDDVDKYYSSTGTGVGELNFEADFPCAYFYRPYSLQTSVKLTGCKEESYCSAAWPAIEKSSDKTFFSVSTSGSIEISRAFAHWAFENKDGGAKSAKPNFTYLKALATASSGLCFTETGKSLQSLTLSSKLAQVFLVTKDGKCVSLSEDGAPSITSCADSARVSVDAGTTTCIAGTGDSCPTFAFSTSFDTGISLKERDELVAGSLSFGSKGCLVVDGAEVSYSTDKTKCSVIKASYIASTVSAGDPVDPDQATDAATSQAPAPAAPARKREIDDPDPESNP